jgi:hypothetical protein
MGWVVSYTDKAGDRVVEATPHLALSDAERRAGYISGAGWAAFGTIMIEEDPARDGVAGLCVRCQRAVCVCPAQRLIPRLKAQEPRRMRDDDAASLCIEAAQALELAESALREVDSEIRRINAAAGHTVFNPAATALVRQAVKTIEGTL